MKKEDLKKSEALKKGKAFVEEFKEFIAKGNVIDMAVGVIIGSAFGKIVTSLVNDILMPILGMLVGGIDFTNLTIKFKKATITYGVFLQNIVDFLIIAFCIFLFVKLINRITEKKEEKEEVVEEVKKDEQIILLEEIRDLLKK